LYAAAAAPAQHTRALCDARALTPHRTPPATRTPRTLHCTRQAILFIDDIHAITGPNAQQGGGVNDASVMLKPLLARCARVRAFMCVHVRACQYACVCVRVSVRVSTFLCA
jgi:hypothetical protein